MKRIVLLGTSRRVLVPLLTTGHHVVSLYEPWEAARVAPFRARLAGACAVDTHLSVESLLSALHHIDALATPIDAVIATGELGVVSAAVLGRVLGARAMDPAVALRCRDKALQKAAWRSAGVATAPCVVVPDAGLDDGVALARAAGVAPPFVVKPTAGYGTRNVAIAADEAELAAIIERTVADEPSMRRLLIEQYVGGDEWHFDGIVRAGQLQALHASRYAHPLVETKRGLPAASIASSAPGAEAFTRRALAALGLDTAVFHFEVFAARGSRDFVAGELAARPGGNAIGDLVKRSTGVDLWAASTLLFTGDELAREAPLGGRVHASTHLPSLAGRRNRVRAEDVLAIPGVAAVPYIVEPGVVMRDMRESSAVNIGYALIEGATEEACEATIVRVADVVRQINEEAAA